MVNKYIPDNVFIYNIGKEPLSIVTPLRVYNNLTKSSMVVNALWDTGASQSLVSERIVNELGLEEASEMHSATANGNMRRMTTLCFALPGDRDYMAYVEAAILPDAIGAAEFVIGLDIITMGNLLFEQVSGDTILKFIFDRNIFISRDDDSVTILQKMAMFKKKILDRKKKSLGLRD
ncbi:hypothetical protein PRBRB14_02260 [Hallella multisaccharivorax DSM 17128]|uniref:Peptidase A2 domain-containing protein n=1 Tax=Hallella multisaccharivorax DSM 17128 TaxID=688246 RepID=F8NB34_9BACT|nr:retroviral-like aspartic protease family protein [Hallella multisaccharivorax]EGN55852.1 hypothetical protein Premu_0370 [Hallella multisaccharivorax DSM 17128]GJG29347.1 hypothetical protein PRBRB14_02260 [Hallella multisaccharivorax DSM 17128]